MNIYSRVNDALQNQHQVRSGESFESTGVFTCDTANVVKRLSCLEEYLPNQKPLVYEFGKAIADAIDGNTPKISLKEWCAALFTAEENCESGFLSEQPTLRAIIMAVTPENFADALFAVFQEAINQGQIRHHGLTKRSGAFNGIHLSYNDVVFPNPEFVLDDNYPEFPGNRITDGSFLTVSSLDYFAVGLSHWPSNSGVSVLKSDLQAFCRKVYNKDYLGNLWVNFELDIATQPGADQTTRLRSLDCVYDIIKQLDFKPTTRQISCLRSLEKAEDPEISERSQKTLTMLKYRPFSN